MYPASLFIIGFFALALLFPEEILVLIRHLRQWLDGDIRRRVSSREWERIQDEFDD